MEGILVLKKENDQKNISCIFYQELKKNKPLIGQYYACKLFIEDIHSYKNLKIKITHNFYVHVFNFVYLPTSINTCTMENSKAYSGGHISVSLEIETGNLHEIVIRVY